MKSGNKPDYVLGVILTILALPVVFLLGFVFGSGVRYSDLVSSASIATWVSALATLAIAVLTLILAKETWQLRLFQFHQLEVLRKNSIRPEVDVYLARSKSSFNVMNVVVENMGSGAAKNVTFRFEGSEFGQMTTGERLLVEKLNALEMFKTGIQALGLRRQKRSFLFMNYEIYEDVKEDFFNICLKVHADYEDIDGDFLNSTSIWDFSEYKGASELGYGDPADEAAKHLEKISKSLSEYNDSLTGNRIKVDVFTGVDRNEERDKANERRRRWQEKHKGDSAGNE